MKYVYAILVSIFVSAQSFASACGDHPFYASHENDGRKIGLFANSDDFLNSPTWDIDDGEPPLSISVAVSLVKNWAKDFYPKFDSVSISTVGLQRLGCWDLANHWVYVFSLAPVIDGNTLYGGGYVVAVTMAGKIVPPKSYVDKNS